MEPNTSPQKNEKILDQDFYSQGSESESEAQWETNSAFMKEEKRKSLLISNVEYRRSLKQETVLNSLKFNLNLLDKEIAILENQNKLDGFDFLKSNYNSNNLPKGSNSFTNNALCGIFCCYRRDKMQPKSFIENIQLEKLVNEFRQQITRKNILTLKQERERFSAEIHEVNDEIEFNVQVENEVEYNERLYELEMDWPKVEKRKHRSCRNLIDDMVASENFSKTVDGKESETISVTTIADNADINPELEKPFNQVIFFTFSKISKNLTKSVFQLIIKKIEQNF